MIYEHTKINEVMKTMIREATSDEIMHWDELISRFANHRVTHTSAWLRSLENSINGKLIFLVYEKNGEIVGCLPGMITRVGPFRLFGSPLRGWQTTSMGPVFDKHSIATVEMFELLIDFLKARFRVHHIEVVTRDTNEDMMKQRRFSPRAEYTFTAPLFPRDPDRVLKRMKTNARRNIKRGIELGLITRFREDDDFPNEVYDQITEVFHRGGNVVPFSKTRVEEFFLNMKASGNMLAVATYLPDGKTCVATGLFTVENKELLLWMWTHRTEHRWCRPTELMTWTVMQKAMEIGCEKIDFMGRGDFKAKLGANINEPNVRWIWSRYGLLTRMRDFAEMFYRWQQSLRGKYVRRQLVRFNSNGNHGVSA